MSVRKFTAPSMREAMLQIREQLGADAIILDQCRQGSQVQISACLDVPADYIKPQSKRNVAISPRPHVLTRGWYRFIGPRGAGKTTTLLKLAANHVFELGSRNLLLLSVDNGRLAANEQLLLAGELLNVEVQELADEQHLVQVLSEMASSRVVLIDTQGLDTGNPPGTDLAGVETYFVASATQQKSYLLSALHSVAAISLQGCAITHVDEAVNLDEILSVCCSLHKPVTWIGLGASLCDDIVTASAESLEQHASRCNERLISITNRPAGSKLDITA